MRLPNPPSIKLLYICVFTSLGLLAGYYFLKPPDFASGVQLLHSRDYRQHQCTNTTDSHQIYSADLIHRLENGYADSQNTNLSALIRDRWIVGPSTSSYSLGNKHRIDFSEVGQAKLVDRELNGLRNGFFVEAGAANGEDGSNSLFLEKWREWNGLLVEANPYFFSGMMQKNRKAYAINACLSTKNESFKHSFRPLGGYGGLAGMLDERKIDAALRSNPELEDKLIYVQCFTLYSIMNAIGRNVIDYLSLDVEGAELEILKTIPFNKLYIRIIGIEYSYEHLPKIREFLHSTKLYTEIGILPQSSTKIITEKSGLDVFFKHI